MSKTLLNEIKRVNELAGTQLTKEQEIAWIKSRLQELEFTHQASFDAYRKAHKMRPDTKVTIAGKETTVGDASKKPGILQRLGAKLFGKKEEPIEMPKLDSKNALNRIMITDPKHGDRRITIGKIMQNPEKYKHLAAKVQSMIDVDPKGTNAQKYIDKKNKQRRDAVAQRKAAAEKEKEYQQWRKDNPELAKKKDDEEAEQRKKAAAAAKKRDDDARKRRKKWDDDANDYFGTKTFGGSGFGGSSSSGGGFGGFGGGSFGGGGASGGW